MDQKDLLLEELHGFKNVSVWKAVCVWKAFTEVQCSAVQCIHSIHSIPFHSFIHSITHIFIHSFIHSSLLRRGSKRSLQKAAVRGACRRKVECRRPSRNPAPTLILFSGFSPPKKTNPWASAGFPFRKRSMPFSRHLEIFLTTNEFFSTKLKKKENL